MIELLQYEIVTAFLVLEVLFIVKLFRANPLARNGKYLKIHIHRRPEPGDYFVVKLPWKLFELEVHW